MLRMLIAAYTTAFGFVERVTQDWLPGLAARLVFSSVLMMFFLNSAKTKVGAGFPDLLIPQSGAYAQMLPKVAEAAGYNVSKIDFFPYKLIVLAGTYAEFILPVLILVGLFTRGAAVAFIGFISVMSYIDVFGHGATAETIGALFDRIHDSPILDQRLLWLFPLLYLAIKGPGRLSLDWLLLGLRQAK